MILVYLLAKGPILALLRLLRLFRIQKRINKIISFSFRLN